MRLFKPHWRRPRPAIVREFWRGRYSVSLAASVRLGDPLFKARVGKWAFIVHFEHADDCVCDGCLPF